MTERSIDQGNIISGISASTGVAIGDIYCINQKRRKILPKLISKDLVEQHIADFYNARNLLVAELGDMLSYLDGSTSEIIETQKQIVLDVEIETRVLATIKEEFSSCDYAIYQTFSDFIERLKESGSELFRQRIVDLENLRDRLINLVCRDDNSVSIKKGTILVTKDLSPTELIAYHESGISGLVMEKGGVTSHAALIAQSLEIPCIVSAKNATSKARNVSGILDGREGKLIINPSDDECRNYKKVLKKQKNARRRILKNITEPSVTKSGTAFTLAANIEFESELKNLDKYNAKDIGLLRTEGLLFKGKTSFEAQKAFYNSVLNAVSGTVTIRLFDVGGDKLSSKLPTEANPFLGWRGIRMLLDERNILDNQIKALLVCASEHPGRIQMLVPMISVEEEILELNQIVEKIESELLAEGIQLDVKVPIGAMIEVPSAALNAENLANNLDFMSIGTNDLTQYTLAVDRGNERICSLYQQYHPAIWRLIEITSQAAKKKNIPVSVCGELAGTPLGASGLIGLGVTNLSMISVSIPKVKEELISHTDSQFEILAKRFVEASNTKEVQNIFEDWRNHQ